MLNREQTYATGARPESQSWKLLWSLFLFFCAAAISSCGAASAPVTIVQPTPQPTKESSSFHTTIQTFDGDFTLTLDITPNRSGTNAFRLNVMDNSTSQPATTVAITLYTTMQDMAMGTDSLPLHADGQGQFSATGNNLSMGGRWAIGITVETSDHVIHKAGVSFVMPV